MSTTLQYNVSEARKNFSSIIDEVSKSDDFIEIKTRNRLLATLSNPKYYLELFSNGINYKNWMSMMFVEKLFPDGSPGHIKESQVSEFKKLSINKLSALIELNSLPISPNKRKKLIEIVGKRTIERLEKRYNVAQSVVEAEKEGLYDITEDATGKIDLS